MTAPPWLRRLKRARRRLCFHALAAALGEGGAAAGAAALAGLTAAQAAGVPLRWEEVLAGTGCLAGAASLAWRWRRLSLRTAALFLDRRGGGEGRFEVLLAGEPRGAFLPLLAREAEREGPAALGSLSRAARRALGGLLLAGVAIAAGLTREVPAARLPEKAPPPEMQAAAPHGHRLLRALLARGEAEAAQELAAWLREAARARGGAVPWAPLPEGLRRRLEEGLAGALVRKLLGARAGTKAAEPHGGPGAVARGAAPWLRRELERLARRPDLPPPVRRRLGSLAARPEPERLQRLAAAALPGKEVRAVLREGGPPTVGGGKAGGAEAGTGAQEVEGFVPLPPEVLPADPVLREIVRRYFEGGER